jgi:hypothetical protein
MNQIPIKRKEGISLGWRNVQNKVKVGAIVTSRETSIDFKEALTPFNKLCMQ